MLRRKYVVLTKRSSPGNVINHFLQLEVHNKPNQLSSTPISTNLAMPLPVIPTLTEWAKTRVTALFEAKTAQEFDDAFNAFLAHHVDSIVVNGKKLSKAEYKASLERLRAPELSAKVEYLGDVEARDEKEGEQV